MSKGRFMFPMSIVPPDGTYVDKVTGREYDLKLHSTLMRRTRTTELNLDPYEDDASVPWEQEDFPVPRSATIPLTADGEYPTEKVVSGMEYDEIKDLIRKLISTYRPDPEVYDVVGWPRARRVAPITHEELKRVRRMEDDEGFMDIARFLAEVITGHETMNVLLLGVGASGSGKSVGLNHLLWGTAIWTADIQNQDPAKWRDYYPYWNNCRVIDKEGFADLFKDLGYMTIKLGDDAFNALNRVKFQSEFIEEVNTIAATDRVFRGVTAFSCQWAGMIDKIIRELAGYRIDFKRDKNARAWNELNRCKFHILDFNQYDRHNPIYTKYFHTRHMDVEDHFSGIPCEELMEWYNVYRILGAVMLKKRPKDEGEEEKNKYNCPECGSSQVRASAKDGSKFCRKCGNKWTPEQPEPSQPVNELEAPKRKRGRPKKK
jgi:ribosomal protein L37AE/L43A